MEVTSYMSGQRETEPVEAVVIHRAGDRFVGVHHRVREAPDGGAPYLSAGELLTHGAARDLSLRLTGQGGARLVLPPEVLVSDPDLLAWWTPAQRRPIWFDTGGRSALLDERISGRAALHPPLLLVARPGGLCAYALPASRRPSPDTPLLRAPYFNLYATGRMCEGDVPMPDALLPTRECLAGFETAFFDSSFAHTNLGAGQLVRWAGGHRGFWACMAASDHRHFPYSALVPLTMGDKPLTLERAVNTDASRLTLDA